MRSRRLQYGLLALGGLIVLAVAFEGCVKAPDDWEGKGGPPRVVVSFPPLYSFVKSVGGEHVGVISVCTTEGPHEYQAKASDSRMVRRADIFFASGLGLEHEFPEKVAGDKAGIPGFIIKLGDRLPRELIHKDTDGKEDDPHIWLGIPQAKAMVEEIRKELVRVDPTLAADYDANAAKYQKKLDDLLEYGKKAFADKKDRQLISFHESLGYFAETYGLKIVDVIEVAPGDEPSADQRKKLIEEVLEYKVRVLAVEPQYPKSTSAQQLLDTLKGKQYTDLSLVEIDPLETADEKDLSADLYERTVKANIDNLAKSLK